MPNVDLQRVLDWIRSWVPEHLVIEGLAAAIIVASLVWVTWQLLIRWWPTAGPLAPYHPAPWKKRLLFVVALADLVWAGAIADWHWPYTLGLTVVMTVASVGSHSGLKNLWEMLRAEVPQASVPLRR